MEEDKASINHLNLPSRDETCQWDCDDVDKDKQRIVLKHVTNFKNGGAGGESAYPFFLFLFFIVALLFFLVLFKYCTRLCITTKSSPQTGVNTRETLVVGHPGQGEESVTRTRPRLAGTISNNVNGRLSNSYRSGESPRLNVAIAGFTSFSLNSRQHFAQLSPLFESPQLDPTNNPPIWPAPLPAPQLYGTFA